jgi:hypothetical protein
MALGVFLWAFRASDCLLFHLRYLATNTQFMELACIVIN